MIGRLGEGRRLAGGIAVLALTVVQGGACKRGEPPSEAKATPSSGPVIAPPAPPADHLAPGELVEGTQHALGVLLPQVVHIRESFVDVVYASGPTSVAALVPYFRAHLRGGDLHASEFLATFEHVHAALRQPTARTGHRRAGRPDRTPEAVSSESASPPRPTARASTSTTRRLR